MKRVAVVSLACALLFFSFTLFPLLADSARQLIVATAPDDHAYHASLRLFSRANAASPWHAESDFVPALFGENGLAWGRGLNAPQAGLQKMERDGCTPAGRFRLGLVIGNDAQLPAGSRWPFYHQKTERDVWGDDPALPFYNQLFTLAPGQTPPAWFESHRMKLNDPAYQWLVLVEHNYPQPKLGAGSAIFLHVRRGENRPTGGCTAMERGELEKLIRWLDPAAQPQLVQLSAPNYARFWKTWDLPEPALALPSGPPAH